MTETEVKALIQQELPGLLAQDQGLRDFILRTVSEYYTPRHEFSDRFDRILDELRSDREAQARKWDEQARKWDEQAHKWDEQAHKWDEQARKWEEQGQRIDTILARMDREHEEQARKWDEQHQLNQQILEEIKALNRKHDSTIGALGSRWGLNSEASFRNALKGILGDSFGVEVLNLNLYDQEGEIFGRPEQVEIDLIIKNGLTIACEIKSSIDKAGMYIFSRKADFYAQHENREINRKIVISPMVDSRALPLAKALGIEIYSYADDVENL